MFSPDGKYLAYDLGGSVAVLNVSTGQKRVFDSCENHSSFGISSEDVLLAVVCATRIQIYQGAGFNQIARAHYSLPTLDDHLIFSLDGKELAMVSGWKQNVTVKKWKKAGVRQRICETLERIGLKIEVDEN